jgi:hypothetical protein
MCTKQINKDCTYLNRGNMLFYALICITNASKWLVSRYIFSIHIVVSVNASLYMYVCVCVCKRCYEIGCSTCKKGALKTARWATRQQETCRYGQHTR